MFKTFDAFKRLKYVGRSKASVIDNRDPLNKGRIRVDHPILGQTSWIPYLRTPHQFDVPSIGDLVYIECDVGEYEYPVAFGNLTKEASGNALVPSTFKRDIPTNRGLYTPAGHLIELDDGLATETENPDDTQLTTNSRGIKITSAGNNKIHIVEDTVNSKQYILLQDAGGNIVKLDYLNNQLTITSIGTTNFSTAQNRTDTVGGNLTITVTGDVSVTCTKATVNSSGNTEVTAGAECKVTSSGKTTVTASQIELNGSSSGITTMNSHQGVIDFITGVPVNPSPTVKSVP